jgi:DNA sulfur modification protein DndE
VIKNIICKGANRAIWLQGLPEMPIQGISFEQIHIRAQEGMVCIDADQIKLKDVTIKSQTLPVYTLYNSHHVQFDQVHRNTAGVADEAFIRVDNNSSHIIVDSVDITYPLEQPDG